jgi:hypothetical protein
MQKLITGLYTATAGTQGGVLQLSAEQQAETVNYADYNSYQ